MSRVFAVMAILLIAAVPAAAIDVKEFQKFSIDEQSLYIGAAVNMLAYTYAANGQPSKAQCVHAWYTGEPGKKTPGPMAVTVELSIALKNPKPEQFQVEGIIMGLADQVCGPDKPATAYSR